jgi:hypothetical protein
MDNITKQKTLTEMLGVIYATADKQNLNADSVNKIVKETQEVFRNDFKQTELRCFACEDE